ncbi:MAG TPA: HlyD family efflux transporter periplasmic adaptor subunit [Ktedonosporobacter sp.]|nr:HlyD family efflux transporter periplasmic adaptor subunit [Ktedonosporobacter sp.]
MRRMILVPLLIVLAVLAIAGGIFYYAYNSYLYYTTDDAQLSGTIVPVMATSGGQLTTLSVKQGDTVTAGQAIATITPASNGATTTPSAITLTSPIAGTILQTPVVAGQAVTPGLPLVELTDLNTLTVTAYVDEGSINNVKTGQDVDIHVDAFSDTTFSGKVQQIVQATAGSFSLLPTQDNASGNFTKVGQRIPVIISLTGNSGKNIIPGMSAEVTIHIH